MQYTITDHLTVFLLGSALHPTIKFVVAAQKLFFLLICFFLCRILIRCLGQLMPVLEASQIVFFGDGFRR